ncbi:MAG: hypothetical protein E6845_06025 [Clostridium sp.]|uniref:hypothetical protein n=1 Tax=Clostridium TaxID=1485 RepID=UPI00136B7331|nr:MULTISPECIES: hypothetical protein [Clostridium]MDU1602504.1 hypothetical protein [Clostridium sp.]MZI79398.1 hypothetical protein [Clostridium butyricum]
MEFISANEFLKQDEKVRQMFLDWWKPSVGDLFSWIKNNYEYENDLRKLECCNSDNIVEMTKSFKGINEGDRIPLLTEGQLRKFIEDKTAMGTVNVDYFEGYRIKINISMHKFQFYKYLGNDLLKAYWKVAIQIAEQEGKKND